MKWCLRPGTAWNVWMFSLELETYSSDSWNVTDWSLVWFSSKISSENKNIDSSWAIQDSAIEAVWPSRGSSKGQVQRQDMKHRPVEGRWRAESVLKRQNMSFYASKEQKHETRRVQLIHFSVLGLYLIIKRNILDPCRSCNNDQYRVTEDSVVLCVN